LLDAKPCTAPLSRAGSRSSAWRRRFRHAAEVRLTHDQLLQRVHAAWIDFEDSYAGLSDDGLMIHGVTGQWSVRDIIAHVTWWEEEALKSLPVIRAGRRWPRYSVAYGGVDAFNAMMTEQRRRLSLAEVKRQHDDVHAMLIDYIRAAPAELIRTETRFRRRIRLDAYSHYPVHAAAIRAWRERTHR
jgi:hypothetical protein